MRYAFGDTGLRHSRNRITAADDDRGAAIGGFRDGARDANCSLVERWLFKNSHRSIPDDGARIAQSVGEMRDRLYPNIHAGVAGVCEFNWNGLGNDLVALYRFVAVNYLMIGGQQ